MYIYIYVYIYIYIYIYIHTYIYVAKGENSGHQSLMINHIYIFLKPRMTDFEFTNVQTTEVFY